MGMITQRVHTTSMVRRMFKPFKLPALGLLLPDVPQDRSPLITAHVMITPRVHTTSMVWGMFRLPSRLTLMNCHRVDLQSQMWLLTHSKQCKILHQELKFPKKNIHRVDLQSLMRLLTLLKQFSILHQELRLLNIHRVDLQSLMRLLTLSKW